MVLSQSEIEDFKQSILLHYQQNKRNMPWRETTDAYKIFVSECMLQQTQVNRVIDKYYEFLLSFPTIFDLAKAQLSDVLKVWSGLGYNRRAMYLKNSAEIIVKQYQGEIPNAVTELSLLPGIGIATASAICVYAYNMPLVYVETNIRTVFIHFFFFNSNNVCDKDILKLVEQTVDLDNPRRWYWALMDYGTFIKKTVGNLNIKSKTYAKQSKFQGSVRQKRGEIMRIVLRNKSCYIYDIETIMGVDSAEIQPILNRLVVEKIITITNGIVSIA